MRLATSQMLVRCLSLASLVVASGCTQSSQHAASNATPTAVASAAAAEAPTASAQPAESNAEVDAPADATASAPQQRVAAKPVIGEYGANVPPVLLSSGHAKLCKVVVGDEFPMIQLPSASGGASAEITYGPKATVVVFWTTDRWMSATALRDLAAMSAEGVSIVGIAVGAKPEAVSNMIAETGAKFTQLLDADGAAFAQVGQGALPRVYVLDPRRQIAWFDIEYSEATRRELQQAIAALTK